MKRFIFIAALCLLVSPSLMAEDFGLTCEKRHGNGKYIMHLVSVGHEAYVLKDNLFRAHMSAGEPQSVSKIESTNLTDVYQKAYWGGKDQYIVSKRGEYIRSESTNTAQRLNDKFDENCRKMTSQEIESILSRARRQPATYSDSPFGQ